MTQLSRNVESRVQSRAILVLAPLGALIYPELIWSGTAISPVLLLLSPLPALFGVVAAYQAGLTNRFRWSRLIAHFAVGAPALFSFLGGWLDFQHAIPLNSVRVWIPLWSLLAIVAVVERPAGPPSRRRLTGRGLAFAHGFSAVLITVFVLVHLANHLLGILSGELHSAFMSSARSVYRFPAVELSLAIGLLFQFTTGLALLWRRLAVPSTSWLATLQTTSGTYIAIYLLSHLSAVGRARYLRHVDTDWVWLTASNLLTDPWSARLTPYYFLGVIAFGVHGACGLRSALRRAAGSEASARRAFQVVTASACFAAVVIMVGMVRASMHP